MKDYVDKLVEIKIRGYEYFIGILIDYGSEWVILRNISGDYIIDGFKIVNKKFIKSIELVESEPIRTIIKLKHLNFVNNLNYNLDDTVKLVEGLKDYKALIFMLLTNEYVAFVGFVGEINERSLILEDVTSKGKISGFAKKYTYDKIRIFEINTDYLNSLEIYLKFTQKENDILFIN